MCASSIIQQTLASAAMDLPPPLDWMQNFQVLHQARRHLETLKVISGDRLGSLADNLLDRVVAEPSAPRAP